MCVCVRKRCEYCIHVCTINTQNDLQRGLTVQVGKVSASAWMDCKVVMVMSTNCQPSGSGTVHRKQMDGSSVEVACPESIICYNRFMGGVDRADQLRGYYRCRSKSRKFYIFFFLFDVAITNTFILMKNFVSSCPFKNFKSFRLQLAKDLIGEYCSRRRRSHGGSVIHPLPFRHYPIQLDDDNNGPRHLRGLCALHRDIHHRCVLSTRYCRECREWLCHSGDPSSDCFMQWHTRLHI